MKGTEHFKQAIKSYLDERAKTDELFAVAYAKENKNLDDCVTFIPVSYTHLTLPTNTRG